MLIDFIMSWYVCLILSYLGLVIDMLGGYIYGCKDWEVPLHYLYIYIYMSMYRYTHTEAHGNSNGKTSQKPPTSVPEASVAGS